MRPATLIGVIWLGAMGSALMPTLKMMALQPPIGFRLDGYCQWVPKPWAAFLRPARPIMLKPKAQAMLWDCYRAKGLKSPTPFVREIRASWPTKSELAQMETEGANDMPLSAAGPYPLGVRASPGP